MVQLQPDRVWKIKKKSFLSDKPTDTSLEEYFMIIIILF